MPGIQDTVVETDSSPQRQSVRAIVVGSPSRKRHGAPVESSPRDAVVYRGEIAYQVVGKARRCWETTHRQGHRKSARACTLAPSTALTHKPGPHSGQHALLASACTYLRDGIAKASRPTPTLTPPSNARPSRPGGVPAFPPSATAPEGLK